MEARQRARSKNDSKTSKHVDGINNSIIDIESGAPYSGKSKLDQGNSSFNLQSTHNEYFSSM
jgi:hypothetical protein